MLRRKLALETSRLCQKKYGRRSNFDSGTSFAVVLREEYFEKVKKEQLKFWELVLKYLG